MNDNDTSSKESRVWRFVSTISLTKISKLLREKDIVFHVYDVNAGADGSMPVYDLYVMTIDFDRAWDAINQSGIEVE